MIAFAVCIGERRTYERWAQAGIARCAEPDAPVAEIESDSIFDGYNEALDAFADAADLEALVLLHEDVEILDPSLCARVRRSLRDPAVAIAGPIGAIGVRSLCWWEGEIHGRVIESRGVIGPGDAGVDVDAVDGLLMVLSPWAVRHLRFDAERFHGFHGYDVDLCLQARTAGRRILVDEMPVFHHTRGGIGDGATFWTADATLRAKWSALGRDMAGDDDMTPQTRGFKVASR